MSAHPLKEEHASLLYERRQLAPKVDVRHRLDATHALRRPVVVAAGADVAARSMRLLLLPVL
jgi:hypothetical protein